MASRPASMISSCSGPTAARGCPACPRKNCRWTVRIPAMPPGENSLLLVRLDGDRRALQQNHVLRPCRRSTCQVGCATPSRPGSKENQATTFPGPCMADASKFNRCRRNTFAPSKSLGVVGHPSVPMAPSRSSPGPPGNPLQLVALCDGYIAERGQAHGHYPRSTIQRPTATTDHTYFPQPLARDEVPLTPLRGAS